MNQLINGDCLELMKSLENNSIDLILADLPYGTTKNKWDVIIPFDLLWEQYKRISKSNSAIILTGAGVFTAKLILSNESMYKYSYIFEKTTKTGFLNAKKQPLRNHEDVCVFYKKPPIYNPQKTTGHERKVSSASHKRNSKITTNYGVHGLSSYDSTERYPCTVLKFPSDKQKSAIHETQKPVGLYEFFIKTYTNEGAVVLDNCSGSGTNAVACLNTNRKYICMEKDLEKFNSSVERVESHVLKMMGDLI